LRSVQFGIQLGARGDGDPATTPFPSHRLMMEDGVRVERIGFDSIWLPDHYYFAQPAGLATFPEVFTLLTAIAVKTDRVLLGTDVIAATFRHPALLAKMAGAVQELSGGRLILGIGAGNQTHEHNAFGLDYDHRIGRFKEYMPILTGLLNGETVTFEGRYFTLKEASLRTVVPHVPVWIASGGPQMYDLTARYANGWNVAGGRDAQAIGQKRAEFAAACQAVGRDVNDFDVCKLSFIAIAPDDASARRMLDELAAKNNQSPETVAARMTVGTPDTVAAHLKSLTDAGVNHHMLSVAQSDEWPNYLDAIELVHAEVLPRARG